MKHLNYAIGIDVGEKSVGCAAIEYDDDGFAIRELALVSFVHDGGEDPSSGQTKASRLAAAGVARRTRRLHARRRQRLERLEDLLESLGITEPQVREVYDAWLARDRLIHAYIDDPQDRHNLLGLAIMHIARHRGWRNPWHGFDRLEEEPTPSKNLAATLRRAEEWSESATETFRTLGEAVSAVIDRRGRDATIRPRKSDNEHLMQEQVLACDQLAELRLILATQEVPIEASNKICRAVFHSEKPHVPMERIGHDVMPGMSAYPRATRGSLEFQEFRIRAFIANLRLREGSQKVALTPNQHDSLVELLMNWTDPKPPTITDLARHLEVRPSNINRDLLDRESVVVPVDRTSMAVEEVLPKRHALRRWWESADVETRAAWVALISDVTGELVAEDDRLAEAVEIVSLDDDAPTLVEKLADKLQSGRTSYSRESLQALLAHMRAHRSDEFSARCEVFGLPLDWREPLPTLDDPIDHPALQRINTIVRRFIKAAVQQWGAPQKVVVEHVRSAFLGPAALQEYRQDIHRRQRANDKTKEHLASQGVPRPSHSDVRRFQALQRQNEVCLYCGAVITPSTSEMDHIVPDSLGGANTRDNLVAVCRSCNLEKGKRSFVEFARTSQNRNVSLDAARTRIRGWQRVDQSGREFARLQRDVAHRLSLTETDLDSVEDRSMATTAYAALEMRRRIAGSLGIGLENIEVYRGSLTFEARRAGGIESDLRIRGIDKKDRFDRRHHAIDAAVLTTISSLTARTLAERSEIRRAHLLEAAGSQGPSAHQRPWRDYLGQTARAREDFELWIERMGSVRDLIKSAVADDQVPVVRPLRLTPSSSRAHQDGIHRLHHKEITDEWTAAEVDRITDPSIYASMLGELGSGRGLPQDSRRGDRLGLESDHQSSLVTLFPGGGAQTLVRGGAALLGEIHHSRVYAWKTKNGIGFGHIRVFAGELGPLGLASGDVLTAPLPVHSASMRTASRTLRQRISTGEAVQIGWLTSGDEIEINPAHPGFQSGKLGDFLEELPETRWVVTGFFDEGKVSVAPGLLAAEGFPEIYRKDPDRQFTAGQKSVNLIVDGNRLPISMNVLLQDRSLTVVRRTALGRPRWKSNVLPVSWQPYREARKMLGS